MLSYLHSYHAGNFADILKHLNLVHALEYLTQKPKPLTYFDSHAGAGVYRLQGSEAQKNQEFENGIGVIWDEDCSAYPSLALYKTLVQELNAQEPAALNFYPGSPWLASQLLSAQDKLQLCELHPREQTLLQKNLGKDRRVKLFFKDGFQQAIASMPPPSRRGLLLMDPPYEDKQDYRKVVETLVACHKRFATGSFALWYPVVERKTIDRLWRDFKNSGVRNIQVFELGIAPDTLGRGMNGSGMLWINPPWTLFNEMQSTLPFLAEKLGSANKNQGYYRCEQLVAE
ncbi:ribosomal RNA large subunit methyltransferase J [Thiosulfatimonas sediminis]|uniref:Ribosomal RNA large subunit methyltransferase J n=1 Tax=Thiosulfatimonas sediminis TaxID=2675054 RepID=A0A6F8PT81_9GAMM|nr:23S rRNA (adenine(2030)-N(6))-methyltransferase RlmJ [Thiosulfatimonas sediminis]BBP45218.1 ribosomal RNA large subunit methyltransferase J [Thiosulfatimonas sediminis]